jgi:release factor glutamine methyltransferase
VTTYRAALVAARAALVEAGIESAALDARLLMAAAADLDMAALIARGGDAVSPLVERLFQSHLKRRIAGEPVARILGVREFWGLPFEVDASTLVPRPETEILVEIVLQRMRRSSPDGLRVCDLGTGSGAIILALLSELPNATGVAVDRSRGALSVAERNAQRFGLAERVAFLEGDYAVRPEGCFDAVVSNPPYVESGAIHDLDTEVRDHDPIEALDGGPDGLAAYRVIAGRAAELIVPGGLLAVEIGRGQAVAVCDLMRQAGFARLEAHRDLAGIDRVLTGVNTQDG